MLLKIPVIKVQPQKVDKSASILQRVNFSRNKNIESSITKTGAVSGTCMGSIGFSPIAVHKDERIVKAAEYHTTTWEGIVALDDDMIIHVAPASAGTPVPELTRAFIVPKGTMVKINAAIWHLCPLPLNNEVLHAMIILPECTYANDCTVVDFEEKDWFKITV